MEPRRVIKFVELHSRGVISDREFASQIVDGIVQLRCKLTLDVEDILMEAPLSVLKDMEVVLKECDQNDKFWQQIAYSLRCKIERGED